MGAETADGAVNRQLPRNAAFIPGQALIGDFVIGDVIPGAAFKLPALCQPDDTVLRVKLMIHSLDHVTNQRRLVV